MYRGSRKHVLDWTGQASFVEELQGMLSPIKVGFAERLQWMPRGFAAPTEARLERFGPSVMPDSPVWPALRDWWLAKARGANTPNWDIAASCEIENRPGLVLVEAKANGPELKAEGKALGPRASLGSRANHDRIGAAISEARIGLESLGFETDISRDTHYQLSNRIAFTWKLAALGIPTLLIYLGFTGDSGIADAGEPFTDDEHWRKSFWDHAGGIVPNAMFERRIHCGEAPAWMIVRSRPVAEVSPAAQRRSSAGGR